MKEILFKAKRIDNGEWVIGDLSQHKTGKKFIKCGDARSSFQVDENTICQYTGLTDKNGKKIWENDIFKHYNRVAFEDRESYVLGVIVWDEKHCRFTNKDWMYNNIYVLNEDCVYEVIGNIFDNADLVKE